MSRAAPKAYDRGYFDRWYRDPAWSVIQREHLERRVHVALAVAESMLERPVRSVLDVGCGEGPWRAVLRRLRPGVRYAGLDPSPYVVKRFGRRRNLALAGVGDLGTPAGRAALAQVGAKPPFDLIVCCDVLHYVPTPDLARGLRAMARMLGGGAAYLEFFAREDSTIGDDDDFQPRPRATYARLLRAAGFTHLGMHSYVMRGRIGREIVSFERGWATPPGRRRKRGGRS